ncbi:hypothetical protein V4C53_45540 [Paraburkholderia azotifigens]
MKRDQNLYASINSDCATTVCLATDCARLAVALMRGTPRKP